ncbi:hypothetical protein BGW80DRAFT_1459898 [Lactifluus volemus]|nr:hypothetical protein BGW80DRAFT_1459898 [Lactifluus volemus]
MSPTEHLAVTVPGEEETKSKLEGSMLSAPGTIPGTAEAARQAEKDGDSSGPLFSLYHEMTDEEDKMRAERWQKDADGILVFTGLFSVAVTALIAVTVQDLKENPQDRSAFFLEHLYALQFGESSNGTRPSSAAEITPFSVPLFTNVVNAFLLMSLCLNILAALFSLFVQRATRQYLFITRSPRSNPDDRARLREAFVNDFQNSPISYAVWASMISLFVSTGFFFCGLLLYLYKLDPDVYDSVYICAGICVAIYLFIVFMPVERGSAFYLSLFSFFIPSSLMLKFRLWRSTKEIDDRVLGRLFKATIKDSDLVRFFESIPGFCKSSRVVEPQDMIAKLKLHTTVKGLLARTWTSNSLPKSIKVRRLAACVKVADATPLPNAMLSILEDTFPRDPHAALQSVELAHFLKNQGHSKPHEIGLCAQIIIAGIISHVQENDNDWVALAANQLGKSETVIRGYLEHGNDSLLLANLIHITRQILNPLVDDPGLRLDRANASSRIFSALSKFDIRRALPGLRHDFSVLWDEIDRQAETGTINAMEIRDKLHSLYDLETGGSHLPSFIKVRHNPHGETYYVNYITRSTSWTRPNNPVLPDRTQPPTTATISSQSHPTASPLQNGGRSGTSQAVTSIAT